MTTTLRYATLPGLPTPTRPYEFIVLGDGRLWIPADHRGPDLAFALRPEQEAWLRSWKDGLTETWHCEWTFASDAAFERFLAALGPPLDPPLAAPTPPQSPTRPLPPPAPAAPAHDAEQWVLDGGDRGNTVELARVGDIAVAVGRCPPWPRWTTDARRGPHPETLHGLAATYADRFPVRRAGPAPIAHALAAELAVAGVLWTHYRVRGPGGMETHRLLELGDRVALQKLGRRPKLLVLATLEQALDQLGPADVACGLSVPTTEDRAAIEAAGLPKASRARRPKVLADDASIDARIRAAFHRLEQDAILAVVGIAGPPSRCWERIDAARERRHVGAVYTRTAARSRVYWQRFDDGDPMAFAGNVVNALRAAGLTVRAPTRPEQTIAIDA